MAQAGDTNGQRALLAQIGEERVDVSPRFFMCIIDAQGQQPDWVREEMRLRGIVAHQSHSYETQLRMLAEKNVGRAMRVYRELRAQNLLPSEVLLLSFIILTSLSNFIAHRFLSKL